MGVIEKRIFKNASWIVGCKILQSIIALIINMMSARYLGPSNYGLLNYASSIITFVVPLAQLGLRNIMVEEIVSHPEYEGKILGTSLVMSVTASLFCILGCLAFVVTVNSDEIDTIIVCALYGISLVFQMTEMIQYWYQAKLLSKYTAVASLIAYVLVAIYKVLLLIFGKNIYWFAISYAFDYCLISLILIFLYKKLGSQKLSFSFSLVKQLFSRSRYYIISGMMVTIFAQTDKIMIKMMLGNTENGYYSTSVACASLSGFVFLAIIDSFRPVILESRRVSQDHFEKKLSLLYGIIIYLGIAQSIVLTVLAKPVVSILYGEAYLPAIPLLQIVTWYTSFSYMGTIRNIWILAEEKQRYLWIINSSGAILNVLGNYILISVIGVSGAAFASVLTQCFANFLLGFIIKPLRPNNQLMLKGIQPKYMIHEVKLMLKDLRSK